MIKDFLRHIEEKKQIEFERKRIETRGALINMFAERHPMDLIPAWVKADILLDEFLTNGLLEQKYKALLQRGLVA